MTLVYVSNDSTLKQLLVLKIMSHCARPIKSAEIGLGPISNKHENFQNEKCS